MGSSGGRETLTLQRLPKLVAGAIRTQVDADAIRPQVDEKLRVVLAATAFAHDWRNRHVAHINLRLTLDEGAKPLAPASGQLVRTAIDAIADLLNTIETHYCQGAAVACGGLGYLGDATALVYFLRKGLDAQTAELAVDS